MNIAVLFEQSGTFKKVLQSKGHNAKDFDIENKFNETDYQCDLFKEILNFSSKIYKSDLIIAFFPCTYFSNYNDLIISGKWYNFKYMNEQQKQEYIVNRSAKQSYYKNILETLITGCMAYNIPLIIENPVSPFMTKFIETHQIKHVKHIRNKYGDNMKKPTYYLLFNGADVSNLDIIETPVTRRVEKCNHDDTDLNRSLISQTYVNNFVNHITVKGDPLW